MTALAFSPTDVFTVLDASHRACDEAWPGEVSRAFARTGAGALTMAAISLLDEPAGELLQMHAVCAEIDDLLGLGQRSMSPHQLAAVYAARATANSAAHVFADGLPCGFERALGGLELTDFLGLASPLARGGFISFGAGLTTARGLTASSQRRLVGLALHLGRVWEARRALAAGIEPIEARDGTEASMRIGRWDAASARAARTGDPSAASEAMTLWDAFLRDGWVVVRAEAGTGRRRIVLVRVPRQEDAADLRLSPRERAVTEGVARALSNKEIGFELGIPTSSVAVALHRAQRKLGVRTRLELIHLRRWLCPDEA
jgi:DNA-binding CsgD family transcriptional regulator